MHTEDSLADGQSLHAAQLWIALPFAEPVLMWWNFVGFNKAATAKAQRQWEQGELRFGIVGDGNAPRLMPPPLPWRDY